MTKAQLRERQLQAALKAVTSRPGITAYITGRCIAEPGQVMPMTLLALSLLAELEKQGKVYAVADPALQGRQWYPSGAPQKGQEAPDDDVHDLSRSRPEDRA